MASSTSPATSSDAVRPSDLLSSSMIDAAARRAPGARALRADGWTAERIRIFLDALAQCGVVGDAARAAGMSKQSAYAFRNSARGRAFDVAWRAALLLARRHLADEVMSRALNGCVEILVREDGSRIERHRFDNRLTMAVLARLDEQARPGRQSDDLPRRVLHEFDALVDAVCAGSEEAAHFIGERSRRHPRDLEEPALLYRNAEYAAERRDGEGALPRGDGEA